MEISVTSTPTSTVTISRDANGVVSVTPSTPSYQVTDNSHGTMYVKLSSDVTIKVGRDGSITAPADKLKSTSLVNVKKSIFQTYKNDSTLDAAGNTVNNVDNKYVKGDISANQSVQETIKGYMDNLDRLAAGLAYSVNAIQTGSINGITSSQGLKNTDIFTNSKTVSYQLTAADITTLTSESSGTPAPSADRAVELSMLISGGEGSFAYKNGDGMITILADAGITAANIKINSDLIKDPTLLNCNTTSASGTGDGKRANAIANLNVLKMNLSNVAATVDLTTLNRKTFLNGVGVGISGTAGFSDTTSLNLTVGTEGSTVDSYYKTIINNIAVQTQESSRQADTQESRLANLEDQRSQVSGVSLDEETTNLIQFQHAYQANAKMISTIDELLDVVINGLKR